MQIELTPERHDEAVADHQIDSIADRFDLLIKPKRDLPRRVGMPIGP